MLPFRYMLGFPVEVLTGQLERTAMGRGFVFQAAWLAVALALYVVLWRGRAALFGGRRIGAAGCWM